MSNCRLIDLDIGYLLPPLADDWLPANHLARFVLEVVDGLDLTAMRKSYRDSGEASYRPSRRSSSVWLGDRCVLKPQAGAGDLRQRSVLLCGLNQHPDHDTIATFQRRLLPQTCRAHLSEVAPSLNLLSTGRPRAFVLGRFPVRQRIAAGTPKQPFNADRANGSYGWKAEGLVSNCTFIEADDPTSARFGQDREACFGMVASSQSSRSSSIGCRPLEPHPAAMARSFMTAASWRLWQKAVSARTLALRLRPSSSAPALVI